MCAYHANNALRGDDAHDACCTHGSTHKLPHRVEGKESPDDGDGARPMPSTSLC